MQAWGGTRGTRPAHPLQLVNDLRATRKGDKVMLTWSQPEAPSDQQAATRQLTAKVCRNISVAGSASSATCDKPVGEIGPQKTAVESLNAARGKRHVVRFTDTLPGDAGVHDPVQFAVYRIELRDGRRRSAGFSNPVSVPLAPTLPATGLHSELDLRGVYLIWENDLETQPSSLQFDYRIYRSEKGSSNRVAIPYLRALVHTREGERWSGVDTGIEWGKTYSYWVTPVTRVYGEGGKVLAEIEGEDSPALEVTAHDVFSPAVPENLLAMVSEVPGKKFVDLVWAPNTEKDLEAYNVYRREAGAVAARIKVVSRTMLSFQDVDVTPGHTYFYSLSAVDARSNESAKSSEVSASVR
jgi:hypothetical protein